MEWNPINNGHKLPYINWWVLPDFLPSNEAYDFFYIIHLKIDSLEAKFQGGTGPSFVGG